MPDTVSGRAIASQIVRSGTSPAANYRAACIGKSEKDFLNKIDELENDFDKYKDLMQQCFDLIKPEYLNGWLIVNGIFGNIAKDMGFKYSFKPGVKSIFNRFSKEFIQ